MISSPYTLLEAFTPRERWIGGYTDPAGEAVSVRDGLHRHLGDAFRPAAPPRDVPFVIRETRRKHQHTIAELTVWQRRPD